MLSSDICLCYSCLTLPLTPRTSLRSGRSSFCWTLHHLVILDVHHFFSGWKLWRSIGPWCAFRWDSDLQRRVNYPSRRKSAVGTSFNTKPPEHDLAATASKRLHNRRVFRQGQGTLDIINPLERIQIVRPLRFILRILPNQPRVQHES